MHGNGNDDIVIAEIPRMNFYWKYVDGLHFLGHSLASLFRLLCAHPYMHERSYINMYFAFVYFFGSIAILLKYKRIRI